MIKTGVAGNPPRGSALPEALWPHRRQGVREPRGGAGQSTAPPSTSATASTPTSSSSRAPTPTARWAAASRRRSPGPLVRRRRRRLRSGRSCPKRPLPPRKPATRVRARPCARRTPTCALVQLLLVLQVVERQQPPHLQGAGRARLQVHLHHALRRPRRHVRDCGTRSRSWPRTRNRRSGGWRRRRPAIPRRATTSWRACPLPGAGEEIYPGTEERIKGSHGFDDKRMH